MTGITVKEARTLIERGEKAWQEADEKVAVAFARYDAVFKKYNKLYVRERGLNGGDCYTLLESPVRDNGVDYYVTDYYSAVYTLNAKTLEPREHKTAYKALQAAERAIEKAIDRRELIANAIEECKKIMPRVEAVENTWDSLCALAERVQQNRKGA